MRGIARLPRIQLEYKVVLQRLILAGGMAVLFFGCATPSASSSNTAPPKPISEAAIPYAIATLDRADITFSDGHRESVEVGQDGAIVTSSGTQYVRGLERANFEKLLRRQFPGAAKIEIIEYRPDEITVLGEVFHQIHTTMGGGPMRVMDGIASANGFTPLANKRRVKLVRQNAGNVEVYELDLRQMMLGRDVSQNLLLEPGDIITVPRNFL
jgi:protein involved in polysaccharide export with SLBB domain